MALRKFCFLIALACSAPAAAAPLEAPGARYQLPLTGLAPVAADENVVNMPLKVPRGPSDGLKVPAGFRAYLYAQKLEHPRNLIVAPNGDVLVAESNAGKITLLRDLDGDGVADLERRFARGFDKPFGLALTEGALLVGDVKAVWRLPYTVGDLEAGPRRPVTAPGAIGQGGNHWTRNITLDPGGKYVFVAVGSRTNLAEEALPHASIQRFAIDGTGQTTIASGLRNPVGLAFYPGTERLFAVVNERDSYGDRLVPDYFSEIKDGDFFGWPYAYIGRHPDPEFGLLRRDLVARSRAPDLLFEAHSAPIGLVFYDGAMFPQAYRGDAFVALRGSWNARKPTGFKIVRIEMEGGVPTGGYETFASGFWVRGTDRAEVWGRPAGLAVGPDGSLFVADDTGHTVWRIVHDGPPAKTEAVVAPPPEEPLPAPASDAPLPDLPLPDEPPGEPAPQP